MVRMVKMWGKKKEKWQAGPNLCKISMPRYREVVRMTVGILKFRDSMIINSTLTDWSSP